MDAKKRDVVSRGCLLGRAVPRGLERLWDAASEGDAFIEEELGLALLTSRDVLDEGYGEARVQDSEDQAAIVRGYRRVFERLGFFATDDSGGAWAFDLEAEPQEDPPVVRLDSEGTFAWLGIDLAEAVYRAAEDVDLGEQAEEWLADHGFALHPPGELGSTTGQLPSLGALRESHTDALRGKPEREVPTHSDRARSRDALTWLLRPGPEVLDAIRRLRGIAARDYPHENWIACDGAGRVTSIWLHNSPGLTVSGLRYGATWDEMLAKLGEPTRTWETKRCRYDKGAATVLLEFKRGGISGMYVGLNED